MPEPDISDWMITAIGKIDLFEGLDPALPSAIARHCSRRNAPKGMRLYHQGEVSQGLFYVVSGYVRRAVGSREGDEKVLEIVSPGQCCGLAELFGGTIHNSFAEVVKEAVVLEISKAGLIQAVSDNPPLAMRLLSVIAERHAALEHDVATNCLRSGARRLLDYLSREIGNALKKDGETVLELPVPKSVIAARIGITAETLSRAFRDLSEAGLIEVHGRYIVLLEKFTRQYATANGGPILPAEPRHHNRRVEHATFAQDRNVRAWMS